MILLRLLAFIIDGLLIFVPSGMLSQILQAPSILSNLFPQLIFVIYNMICVSSFKGKTVGKYFSKLVVSTDHQNLLTVGMREVAKLLYFIPAIGWLFTSCSFLLYLFTKKTLHDLLGQSSVGVITKKKEVDSYE
jgi:uncharacterized RDD family membrane protein YckC